MKAITITSPGGPEVLKIAEVESPSPVGRQVLIEVHAAGVNRPDCLQRAGLYPVPPGASPLPGLEVAGRVVATGPLATQHQPGDRVMALTHGGGYAEFCVADERHCLAVPDALSLHGAAALPETVFTVWSNVWMRAALADGERLLVHGGSSGIGSTAIQIARALGHAVATTAGTNAKCDFCRALGADVAINYRESDWAQALSEQWTDGADVILDMVGAQYFERNLEQLRRGGRLAIIALIGGATAKEADLGRILRQHLTVFGTTLRPQSDDQKAAIADDIRAHVLPLIAAGSVQPIIYQAFDLEAAAEAHTLMESGEHMGKIVLNVRPERTQT